MIWCYIVIAMFIGIIAGLGYYEVTRSELKLNYEMQELVMMLRNTKRNAILIGVIVGAIWPLALVVLAAVLILVSMSPKTFNDPFDTAGETKNVDLTNHNIVLDKPAESKNVVVDDTATWIDLNEMDETESDNIEDTEPNTKE
jgi:hypothetical protein